MRPNELNVSETDTRNKIDALKQIILHFEEVEEKVRFKTENFKKKTKSLPGENPFDFTEYVEKQKKENEIDLGLLLEVVEEVKNIYNQTPVKTLIEYTEKWDFYEWLF